MTQSKHQKKVNTVVYMADHLLHLRELKTRLTLLTEELALEEIHVSGTHALEKLNLKISLFEKNLLTALNAFLPKEFIPLYRISRVELKYKYVFILKQLNENPEFVLRMETGAIVPLSEIETEEESS